MSFACTKQRPMDGTATSNHEKISFVVRTTSNRFFKITFNNACDCVFQIWTKRYPQRMKLWTPKIQRRRSATARRSQRVSCKSWSAPSGRLTTQTSSWGKNSQKESNCRSQEYRFVKWHLVNIYHTFLRQEKNIINASRVDCSFKIV